MEKIKVSAVSYLNTKPFLFGLEQSSLINQVELSQDIPSVVAEKLLSGKAAIGLLPTVVIPDIPNAQIIGDYCIGSNGAVGSVCIYSQVPLGEVKQVYLDYQSRTSVELLKILLRDFWKINPQLIPASLGYENKITGNTAGLIIGDRALQWKKNFQYCYDLGKAWKDFTGLPFVFACWVSNQTVAAEFISSFNNALKEGVENITSVANQNQFFYPDIDTLDYLSNKIQYPFTEQMREGMETFLQQVKVEERV